MLAMDGTDGAGSSEDEIVAQETNSEKRPAGNNDGRGRSGGRSAMAIPRR